MDNGGMDERADAFFQRRNESYMRDRIAELEAQLAEAEKKAKLWDKHRMAIAVANDILQVARPTILNMMRIEDAAKDTGHKPGEGLG